MPRDTLAWVAADGTVETLTGGAQHEVPAGVRGRGMPPISLISEAVPSQPGEQYRDARYGVREVDVPIILRATSQVAMQAELRRLARLLDPTQGDGKLRVTAVDGAQRELTCRYAGGFERDESKGPAGPAFQKAVWIFRAFDPFWYDVTTNVESWTTGTPATFFPFFPLRLSGSAVFADTTITNDGDVESWPIWTITGPGTAPILRNLTTDSVIDLTPLSLAAGETVQIDTTPGVKTVQRDDGTNEYGSMTADSDLWSLERGVNAIRLEMSTPTTDSEFQLSYRRRYLAS